MLPARRELPEHLATDLAPGDEALLQQPPAGPARLGLVDVEEPAQLGAAQLRVPRSWRALKRAQEIVGLRSARHRGLRGQALESPVRECDRRVEPSDQVLIALGARAGVAEA